MGVRPLRGLQEKSHGERKMQSRSVGRVSNSYWSHAGQQA